MATISLPLRSALIALCIGDLAVALAFPLLWSLGDAVSWHVGAVVDPRGGANLVAWYVSVQLALLACGLGVLASGQVDRRAPGWWCLIALAVAFGGLSFDAIAGVHEWLRQRCDHVMLRLLGDATPIFYTRVWLVVLAGPLVLLLVGLAWGARRYVRACVRGRALLGVVLAVGGSVALEPEFIPLRGVSYLLALAGAQLAELVGVTVLLWATADLLRDPVDQRAHTGAMQRLTAPADGPAADGHRGTA
jgi:hypothetical protein